MKELKRKMVVRLRRAMRITDAYRSRAPVGFDPLATTTIAGYSNELAQVQPPAYAPLQPNQAGGRMRMAFFTKTFASETAQSWALAIIPKGARILNGEFIFSASLGGTTTVSFGLAGRDGSGYITSDNTTTADGVALLFAAAASTSTAKQVLAATVALSYGYQVQKDCYLTLTSAVAAMGTQVLTGHIVYVVD